MPEVVTDQKIILVEKRKHRGEWQIFLHFDHTAYKDIDRAVRKLPKRKYSGTLKRWYIPYSKTAYATLQRLPFAIKVLHESKTEQPYRENVNVDTSYSGTTAEIRPKGENNGTSKPDQQEKPQQDTIDRKINTAIAVSKASAKEHIVDSSTDQSKTTNTPGVSTSTWTSKNTEVSMNAKWISLRFVYDVVKLEKLKRIKGAWWNAKSNVWLLKPLPEHVEAIQKIFAPFGKTEYEQAYQIACSLSDPIVMEVYETPEHPTKIAVKIRGYGVSTAFMKSLPERNYDKVHKRWLIPRSEETVDRLLAHYGANRKVTIKNRLTTGKEPKPEYVDLQEKQRYLLSKFPERNRETLRAYTDTLIRMRYSWKTVTQYTGRFGKYLLYLAGKPIRETTIKEVNSYLSAIAKQKVSESLLHSTVNAIKFYYEKVVFSADFQLSQIKRPKKSHRLPVILSIAEVDRMMRSSTNLKHTAILYLLYSSGLRLNELLSLKLSDIYWDRNQLFVRGGKGKKDRTVMLSETLKSLLTLYFDQYQPKVFLFNGQDGESAYSSSSVQQIVKKAAHAANIKRRVTPHVLRHCFATHLMESGTDVRYIQELLGHKDIKTTLIYTHVTNKSMKQITSPLDALGLNNQKA